MKTLNFFIITVLFAFSSIFSSANEYNETSLDVQSINDLRTTIKQIVCADFKKYNNYFYQNNIDRIQEDVFVEFYIDKNMRVKLLNVTSDSKLAIDYVTQTLAGKKIKISDSSMNRKFNITIKLDYKT